MIRLCTIEPLPDDAKEEVYSNLELYVGYFCQKNNMHGDPYYIHELDDFDEKWLGCMYVPDNQRIFRCYTHRSMIVKIRFLVKIDFSRGLVYFNGEKASDSGKVAFDSGGAQITYMRLKDPYYSLALTSPIVKR
jgi:hypothetical protein